MTTINLAFVPQNPDTLTPLGVGLGAVSNAARVTDPTHSVHAAQQSVVQVTTASQTITELLSEPPPSWATAARIFVGPASGIVYSTDGTTPDWDTTDGAIAGAPLDAYTYGHVILGAASISSLRMIAQTATVYVTIEFLG